MEFESRRYLRTAGIYFLIALVAELAGFIGWINVMTRKGDVFDVWSAFWVHEASRLRVWLPVFVGLSTIRILGALTLSRLSRNALK